MRAWLRAPAEGIRPRPQRVPELRAPGREAPCLGAVVPPGRQRLVRDGLQVRQGQAPQSGEQGRWRWLFRPERGWQVRPGGFRQRLRLHLHFRVTMSGPTVRRRLLPALWVLAALAGCSGSPRVAGDAQAADPAQFLERLAPYCNRAFAGRVLHESPAGAEPEWQQALVLDLRCQGSARLIALSVGEDRSRAMQLGQTVE